jgi:hypothetical protein
VRHKGVKKNVERIIAGEEEDKQGDEEEEEEEEKEAEEQEEEEEEEEEDEDEDGTSPRTVMPLTISLSECASPRRIYF